MLAFDKHLNLVLSQCEEFRLAKASSKKKAAGESAEDEEEEEMKRMLGLVILRGETVVTLSVEGPPPMEEESKGPQVRFDSLPPSLSPYIFINTDSFHYLTNHMGFTSIRSQLDQGKVRQLEEEWDYLQFLR
jgi:small nuclear ribonucleoprotein (snRNP)-like protein